MNAEGMNSVEIDKNCIEKAKEANSDISEDVEAVPEEETETEESKTILVVDKYEIKLIPNNYIVDGKKNLKYDPKKKGSKEFSKGRPTYTYHSSLHGSLIQLSNRILEDKLKDVSKEKPLELKELANLIKEHHEYLEGFARSILSRGNLLGR
jgi:hypothetical protein